MSTTTKRPTRWRLTAIVVAAVLGVVALVTSTTAVWTPGRLGLPATGGTAPGLFLNYQQLIGVIVIALSALIGAHVSGAGRRWPSTSR